MKPRISANGANENLTSALRQKITSGAFPVGMHLSELKLAEQFRVSRTVAREAMRILIKEDLARYLPGRGVFVAEISMPDLIELFHMRGALEPYCARLAARAVASGSPAKLQNIRAAIAKSPSKIRRGRGEEYIRLIHQLDERIATLAGNMRLGAALRQVWAQIGRTQRLAVIDRERMLGSVARNLALIDAVAQGDEERAFNLASQHVQQSYYEATLRLARQDNPNLLRATLPRRTGRR